MLISNETKVELDALLRETFDMNAFCDNVAYNLGFYHYPRTEKVFHENFAHHFPVIADTISDMMIKLDSRPIRLSLSEYGKDYDGDIAGMFEEVYFKSEEYRKSILKTIAAAEFNEDYEVKIKMEEFLINFLPYRKQAELWKAEALRYKGNEKSFDARIDKFTTYIELIDED